MKKILFASFLLFTFFAKATNYYWALSGNDNNAGSQAAPFQTVAKAQTVYNSAADGDSILFRINETYFGSLTLTNSGSASKPIVISSWGGIGKRPVISGMVILNANGWSGSNGLYTNSTVFTNIPRIVVKDNILVEIGRWPDVSTAGTDLGYLKATVPPGNTSTSVNWTDNSAYNFKTLNSSNFNMVGARVIQKTAHYLMDTGYVTSQTYSSSTGFTTFHGNTSGKSAMSFKTGWGYFFVNKREFCNRNGEWYYDQSTDKLTMYNSSALSTSVVEVPVFDNVLTLTNVSNVSINNIDFRGANSVVGYLSGCTNVSINHCDFFFGGKQGLSIQNSTYTKTLDVNVESAGGLGLWIKTGKANQFIRDTIQHVAEYLGMIYPAGSNIGDAVLIESDSTFMDMCRIKYAGEGGVVVTNNKDVTVQNTWSSYSQLQLADCAPFYTVIGASSPSSDRNIKLINCIAEYESGELFNSIAGTTEKNPYYLYGGFYCDNYSQGVKIINCTSIGAYMGIYLHHAKNITLTGNTIYGARRFGIYLSNDRKNFVTGMNISNNIIFSKVNNSPSNNPVNINNSQSTDPLTAIGTFSGNKYIRPFSPSDQVFYTADNLVDAVHCLTKDGLRDSICKPSYYRSNNSQFAAWQTLYSWDVGASITPPISFAQKTVTDTVFSLAANKTEKSYTQRLGGKKWKGTDNVVYDDTITLAPYRSMALTYMGASTNITPDTQPPTDTTGGDANPSPLVPISNLSYPLTGAVFYEHDNITLSASASDPDGTINRVEFYNRVGSTDKLIGTATEYPYEFVWSNVQKGTYTIVAKAYDQVDNRKTSSSVIITINPTQLTNFIRTKIKARIKFK